jgi:anthranilate synthase component I
MKKDLPPTKSLVDHNAKLQVLVKELPADLETPVSAYLKLRDSGAKILLESVEKGNVLGRYSFIGFEPDSKVIIDWKKTTISKNSDIQETFHSDCDDPFMSLRDILDQNRIESKSSNPPLLGGAVGYISYDFIHLLEKIPNSTEDTLNLPLAMFYMIDTILVFDHVQRRLKIMCLTAKSSQKLAEDKLAHIEKLLKTPLNYNSIQNDFSPFPEPLSNFSKDEFCEKVLEIKKHIEAGNVYQLVLSQRFEGQTKADPFMIYRALRMLNPSPYMYFLNFDEINLIGSSPEALVRLENGLSTVRPIAGTRPRGENDEQDKNLETELLNDEKEKAEHVMLVDLGRNDLGRCSEIGTVKVTDFMKIERYSHVMHITSNVTGKLKQDLDQFDLFRATFPAGTVTGAPKIKSMQIIEGLESIKRGPYAGAVGYFSLSGDMDWCITIRTILMKGEKYYLQAGAGIVADSVPEKEYQETCDKLAALKKAIEIAEEGF